MIIRHSWQLLEQLSEIEELIRSLEDLIDRSGLEIDKDSLIEKILKEVV